VDRRSPRSSPKYISTQDIYTERQWTKEETDLLPYDYEPNKILIADSDPDTVIYNAVWNNDPVLALAVVVHTLVHLGTVLLGLLSVMQHR
jgi:hypothetical protein